MGKDQERFNAIFKQLMAPSGQTFKSPTSFTPADPTRSLQAARNINASQPKTNYSQAYNPADVQRAANPNYDNIDVVPNLNTFEKADEVEAAIAELTGGEGIQRPVKNFGMDLLGRAGDIVSRPIYGLYNSNLQFNKALDEGQQPWEAIDEAVSGAWKGVSGEEKTTPGNLVEYLTDPDVERNRTSIGSAYGSLETALDPTGRLQATAMSGSARDHLGTNNWISRNMNRLIGLGGETIGDPANVLGGKVVGVLADGGRYADDVALNASVRKMVQKEIDKLPDLQDITRQGGKRTATGARTGGLGDGVDVISDEMVDTLQDVVMTSQHQAVAVNTAAVKSTAVAQGVNAAKKAHFKKLETIFDRVKKGYASGNAADPLSTSWYQKAIQSDSAVRVFDQKWDDLYQAALNKGHYIDYDSMLDEAYAATKKEFDKSFDKLTTGLNSQIDGSMYNTYALRIGNKNYPVNILGKGVDAAKRKGVGAPRALSAGRQMTGKQGVKIAAARAVGHEQYGDFIARVSPTTRKYLPVQREEIGRHIFNNTNPGGELQEGVDLIRRELEEIWRLEGVAGVIDPTSKIPPNYFPLRYKTQFKRVKRNLKKKRKDVGIDRKSQGKAGEALEFSVDDAKKAGLKPVTDPFEALAVRRIEAERVISRSDGTEGYWRTYGVGAKNMPKAVASSEGLTKIAWKNSDGSYGSIDGAFVNQQMKNYIDQTGETIYFSDDVAEGFKAFNLMTKTGGSEEAREFLKVYDKLLNFFKVSATIPYPGFHVKNIAGDVFMGLMDGVNVGSYVKYLRAKRTGQKNLKLHGDATIHVDQIDDLFAKNASGGGFFESDIIAPTKAGVKGVPGIPRRVGQVARETSSKREDIGRVIHFYHALDEELATAMPNLRGKVTPSVIADPKFQRAIDNATYRVNKFKFDYGFLTATEKKYLKRTIPFYTFMRKSAPLMLEGMLMDPALFGKTQRFFDDGDMPTAPGWMREIGLANITGGGEPLVMPQNVLPYDTLLDWTADPSLKGIANTAINSMAPGLQVPIELGMGKSLFTGADTFKDGEEPSNLQQLGFAAEQFFPPAATARKQYNDIAQGNFDFGEFLFGSRLSLGLSVKRLTNEDQIKAMLSDMSYTQEVLRRLSDEAEPHGIKIFISPRKSGQSVKVKQTWGDFDELYEGDLKTALEVFDNFVQSGELRKPEDEIVKYVTQDQVLETGPVGQTTYLDRILEN